MSAHHAARVVVSRVTTHERLKDSDELLMHLASFWYLHARWGVGTRIERAKHCAEGTVRFGSWRERTPQRQLGSSRVPFVDQALRLIERYAPRRLPTTSSLAGGRSAGHIARDFGRRLGDGRGGARLDAGALGRVSRR